MAETTRPLRHRKDLTPPRDVHLTAREKQIMLLICRGHSQPEIAEHLIITGYTVKTHIQRLLTRTGTANTVELVVYLLSFNLIDATAVKGYMHLRLQEQARRTGGMPRAIAA